MFRFERVTSGAAGGQPASCAMPATPLSSVFVTKPGWVRRAKYRVGPCTPYFALGWDANWNTVRVWCDYCCYRSTGSGRNRTWHRMVATPGGDRGLLQVEVEGRDGRRRRLYLHRVWMFNRLVSNPWNRPCTRQWEVHHRVRPSPNRLPWANCMRGNMKILSIPEHAKWHRDPPDVPRH